jgi:hypothetical protein
MRQSLSQVDSKHSWMPLLNFRRTHEDPAESVMTREFQVDAKVLDRVVKFVASTAEDASQMHIGERRDVVGCRSNDVNPSPAVRQRTCPHYPSIDLHDDYHKLQGMLASVMYFHS